jgi:hypothetical protein
VVPVPSAATVPAAAVKVVANHPAAVGQGAGRVGPHSSAAEGITAHALTGDSLEVGPREFARATRKASGTEIPGCATIERATAIKPAASIERESTVDAATIDAAITAEVAGAAAKITAAAEITAVAEITSAEITSAKVAATEVASTATEVASTATEVTSTTAEPAAAHGPASTATKASTAVAATTAMRPGDRRGRHLARDHGRHDHNSEPLSKLHWLMHRLFSETGWGRQISIYKSEHSAHLLERQWRGVGQVHAVDPSLDHVRRRLPLA